ncbi:MAG: MFS transporter [Rhodospirillaceae bacterium]
MSEERESERCRRRGLAAVMLTALAVGLTIGMSLPLIALSLTAAGAGATLVGVNTAMPALAVLVMAPLAPRLVCALGMVPAAVAGCLLSALSLALFPYFDSMVAWFGLRFAMGLGLAVQWVVSETWLSHIVDSANRGRVVSLYATLWAVGISGGPLLLQVTGIEGARPFLVAAAVLALAALAPVSGRDGVPKSTTTADCDNNKTGTVLRAAAGTIFVGFASGFVELSLLCLLPIYGQAAGLDRESATLMVSVLAAGGLVFQLPFGWLADRFGSGRVQVLVVLACLAACAGPALLPVRSPQLWILLFIWGGVMSGFYTLGLIRIGERFAGPELLRANVLFIMAYTVGTVAGPVLSGIAQDFAPSNGLLLSVAVVCMCCLAVGSGTRTAPPR